MRQKIIYFSALLANIGMILCSVFIYVNTYGSDRALALLLFIPPVLSLLALYNGPDLEERRLARRLKKANLRKELKSLSEFDS